MKKPFVFLSAFLGVLLLASPVLAGDVRVEAAYAYPTADAGNNTTIVSMTLHNPSKQKDRLLSVKSPIAESAALHTTVMDKGLRTMSSIDAITIPAGKRVTLTPQTQHIMVEGLKKPLTPGAMIPLVLTFEKSVPLSIEVPVKDPGSR